MLNKLLDGPVRTRVLWTTLFGAVSGVAILFGVDLGPWEDEFQLLLTLLVSVGALTGTSGTVPVAKLVETADGRYREPAAPQPTWPTTGGTTEVSRTWPPSEQATQTSGYEMPGAQPQQESVRPPDQGAESRVYDAEDQAHAAHDDDAGEYRYPGER